MYLHLIDLIQQHARGLDGYKKAAESAFDAARSSAPGAAGYLILGMLAQRIYETNHGLPLTAADGEKDFQLFERYVCALSRAANTDAAEKIQILEDVSKLVAQDLARVIA
ncbi:hypothetical protein OE766_14015 [Pararhizobium sp. YC-54]|uniref:hypothetical protein n=1 Tax=Pararhizobium sp. YC-54 TaxID=2986920 RepID=UPI0021F6D894|nr:hypothetical protein [Pararhizobium sp. YC-54]MCV9999366.1 hypothetical protein [Pararhizobium sp. YC-54]